MIGVTVTWEEMLSRAAELGQWWCRVGILKSGKGEDKHGEDGPTMIQLGLIHELGLGVPMRRWLRDGIKQMIPQIKQHQIDNTRAVWSGKISAEKGVKLLGQFVSGELKKWLKTRPIGDWELAPSTIEAKGSDRPLIDTAAFVNSITYEVGKSLTGASA